MDSYSAKGFREKLHELNKSDLEHDLRTIDCCQDKESELIYVSSNVKTPAEVKHVPDILDSLDSSALENVRENKMIPSDMGEKLHKIPQLPDEEVRKAIDEIFTDNFLKHGSSSGDNVKFCDGSRTSFFNLEHNSHNKNVNFREELNSISCSSSSGGTEQGTDVFLGPVLSETLSQNLNRRQSKDEVTQVTMLTLLSSEDNDDEHYGGGDDNNIDDNANQILVPGNKNNYGERVSRCQQVCCFNLK